jgi:hypothetical protein
MRKVIYAASLACVFTFVPILILRLDSEAASVNSLKSVAAVLGVPGAFVGYIVASGRVHDIDSWVTGAANFSFYYMISWLLLKAFGRVRESSNTLNRGQ